MGSPISHMQSKQVSASVPLRRRTPQRIARRGPTGQPYAPWRRFRSAIFVGSAFGRYPAVRSGRRPANSEGSHELSIFQNKGGVQGCCGAANPGRPGPWPERGRTLQALGRPAPKFPAVGLRDPEMVPPPYQGVRRRRRSRPVALSTGTASRRLAEDLPRGRSSSRRAPRLGTAGQRNVEARFQGSCPRHAACGSLSWAAESSCAACAASCWAKTSCALRLRDATCTGPAPPCNATSKARYAALLAVAMLPNQTEARSGKPRATCRCRQKRGGRDRRPTAQPMAGTAPKAGSPTKVGRFALAVPRRRTRFSLFVRNKTPAPPDGRVGSGAFCGQPQGRFRAIRRAAQVLPSVIRSAAAAPCFVPAGSGPGRRRERVRAPRWPAPNPKFPCPSP